MVQDSKAKFNEAECSSAELIIRGVSTMRMTPIYTLDIYASCLAG